MQSLLNSLPQAPLPACVQQQRTPRRRAWQRPITASVVCRVTMPQAAEGTGQEPELVDAAPPFKYTRLPCSSLCGAQDTRCHQVEALFQHVLNHPRLPSRVCQWLPTIDTDIATITHTIEGLSRKYGQELTLYFLRRSPHMLAYDLDMLLARAEDVRVMLDLRSPSDTFMVLRKNPNLFCLDRRVTRERFLALQKVLPLQHSSVRAVVRKCPLLLNYRSRTIEELWDSLRSICEARQQWTEDLAYISPSLIAFYLRDSNDIMDRLEYLVETKESPFITLREVMKATSNVFNRRHRGFLGWLKERELRAQQARVRQQQRTQRLEAYQMQQQQQQQFQVHQQSLQAPGAGFGRGAQQAAVQGQNAPLPTSSHRRAPRR